LAQTKATNHKKEVKEGRTNFFSTASRKKKFPENFFDVVFMIASFHHLPDKESRAELLADIYKQLKPKGKLIITVWNLESDWAKSKLKSGWKKMGDNDFLIPWKNPDGELITERYYHHFSKEELNSLLKEAGFKINRIDYSERTNWTDKKGGRNLVAIASK
jgi:SAM-dependent methyltransferase